MSDVAIEPLKRCPFCGASSVGPLDDESPSTIECYNCSVIGPEVPPEESGSMMRGRDYWNSRGSIPDIRPLDDDRDSMEGYRPIPLDIKDALPCPFCGSNKLLAYTDTPEMKERACAIFHPDDPKRAAECVEESKNSGFLSCDVCGTWMSVKNDDPLKDWNFRMPTNGL